MSSLGSTTSLAGLYPLIVRWSFGRSSHGQQTSHNCSRGSCPLSCWPQHSSNSRSSRKISSRFILCLWSSVVQVSYTNTSTKYKYCIQVPAPRPRTRDDPSFESQVGARHFPRTLRIAHARTSCKYHNLSGLLSQSTWGLLYDWRQSRFLLCTSRNVYQRDPGHGLTFDLRLVARYRDGPIIVVGLCLCRRVKSPHRRAVRPPLESLAVSGLSRMQVWLREDSRTAVQRRGEMLSH